MAVAIQLKESRGINPPNDEALTQHFELKYARGKEIGPGPRMRLAHDYYVPDDYYEALVDSILQDGQSWLDVGCGRKIFPRNPRLAERLAERAGYVAGVDPDATINENPFVHERFQMLMDDFRSARVFDLITMRMVAEHVSDPDRLMEALRACTSTGSLVVVYTINRWSPVPVITHLVPFNLHYPAKKLLWNSESKDTFPTAYKMNTRRELNALFSEHGFETALFAYLDDCRTLARWKSLLYMELKFQSLTRSMGLVYPENCILAVYRRL